MTTARVFAVAASRRQGGWPVRHCVSSAALTMGKIDVAEKLGRLTHCQKKKNGLALHC